MSRRASGEGTIRQLKDGRWQARLRLPDGTRTSYYGKRQGDALRKLKEARYNAERGLRPPREHRAALQCLTTWLAVKAQEGLKSGTMQRYRSMVRVHLLPAPGRIRLAQLTVEHLEQLDKAKLDAGLSTRR